jgi:hypothetical protein
MLKEFVIWLRHVRPSVDSNSRTAGLSPNVILHNDFDGIRDK